MVSFWTAEMCLQGCILSPAEAKRVKKRRRAAVNFRHRNGMLEIGFFEESNSVANEICQHFCHTRE